MTNIKTKLLKLEIQKKELQDKLKEEIFKIFATTNSITIDEDLLTGFLIFATDPNNINNPILEQIKQIGKKNKIPSKPRKYNKKLKENN